MKGIGDAARTRPRPRRRFGQHFLHDPNVVERIVAALDPRPGEALVEIGPGRGALTFPVLRRCGELHAIEVDRDLCAHLRHESHGAGTLHLVNEDALTCDFGALAATRRLRVFGNLPYNISTPLLFALLAHIDRISDVHCTLQREVGDRMRAAPGSRHYGRLSVMVQLCCTVERLFPIPAGAFTPRPRVESSFLRLLPHRRPPVEIADRATFEALVRHLFSRRRKTLKSSLRGILDENRIGQAGCDPGARPQTLAIVDFDRLAEQVVAAGRVSALSLRRECAVSGAARR